MEERHTSTCKTKTSQTEFQDTPLKPDIEPKM